MGNNHTGWLFVEQRHGTINIVLRVNNSQNNTIHAIRRTFLLYIHQQETKLLFKPTMN